MQATIGQQSRDQNYIKALGQFWESKCHGAMPPFRSDLGGLDWKRQFLLKLEDDERFSIRRSGLFIDSIWGKSVAGRNFRSLFSSANARLLRGAIEDLLDRPAKIKIHLEAETEITIALWPVCRDYGPVGYALGASNLAACLESPLHAPKIERIERSETYPTRMHLQVGLAEEPARFIHKGERPRFQVIEGNGALAGKHLPTLKLSSNVKREP